MMRNVGYKRLVCRRLYKVTTTFGGRRDHAIIGHRCDLSAVFTSIDKYIHKSLSTLQGVSSFRARCELEDRD